MYNATLVYRISYNNEFIKLKLENNSLYLIDKITSNFKNDDDFIRHYYNKNNIYKFIKEHNNVKGDIVIDYKKDINDKKELMPIYSSKDEIVLNEDYYENKLSEIEKARRLLFNSKNQLFTKLLLKSHILDLELNRMIDLDEDEAKFARSRNIKIKYINNKYYVDFKSLLLYRIYTDKLGTIRNAYQDMLDVLKNRICNRDKNTFYYYNRELKILIDKYNILVSRVSIKNLELYDIKRANYILAKDK